MGVPLILMRLREHRILNVRPCVADDHSEKPASAVMSVDAQGWKSPVYTKQSYYRKKISENASNLYYKSLY